MITAWKADLLAEGSLYEVFRASRRFPKSATNKFIYAIFGMAIASVATVWIANNDIRNSFSGVSTATELAFDLSVQILGFLIGGFAIFATVTDDRLMIRLAQVKMKNSQYSVFKHVFFNFLSVFYIYIITLGMSTLIKISGSVNIIDADTLASWHSGPLLLSSINTVAFCIIASLIMLSIVRLKSFIWNIYQGFLTFLIVSDGMDTHDREGAGHPEA